MRDTATRISWIRGLSSCSSSSTRNGSSVIAGRFSKATVNSHACTYRRRTEKEMKLCAGPTFSKEERESLPIVERSVNFGGIRGLRL